MTILSNKPKKTLPKNERHATTQARLPAEIAVERKPERTGHSHNGPPVNGGENRKGTSSIPSNSKLLPSEERDNVERNSDDEYGAGFKDDKLEVAFEDRLRRTRGFIIKKMRGDGACLFRAVADQVYGDEEMHLDVRRLCLDYMEKNRDHFSQFVTEDFSEYLVRKRRPDVEGNHVELQAISEIYLRPIEIYEYSTEPKNIFNPRIEPSSSLEPNAPLRLSYHGSSHYNSVVDPLNATIGVGLGLPGYSPGAADRNLMREALRTSEIQALEEAMLKDKIKLSDYERTEQEISEQVARESYMEYLRSLESRQTGNQKNMAGNKRSSPDSPPACSSSHGAKVRARELSPTNSGSASADIAENETKLGSFSSQTSSIIGANEWAHAAVSDADERALLAQVLAISHQEYLESLRKKSGAKSDHDQAGSSKTR